MEAHEIDECLASMEIIVDSREQGTFRSRKRYEALGVPYHKHKLEFGDYTYNFKLPSGESLYGLGESEKVLPSVIIERKSGLEELSGNLTEKRQKKHKEMNVRNRFEAELKLAAEHNASIYLLIENANLTDIIHGNYETHLNSKAYFHTITAFIARYDIKPIFCQQADSGAVIKEILYRELKERLTRGDYG